MIKKHTAEGLAIKLAESRSRIDVEEAVYCGEKETQTVAEFVPSEDAAAAISFYIFCVCERPDDWCVQHECVFGGWNRVGVNERGWWASSHHCGSEFLEKLKEHCEWVRIT